MYSMIYRSVTNKSKDKKNAGKIEWGVLAPLAEIPGSVTAGPESSPPEIYVC